MDTFLQIIKITQICIRCKSQSEVMYANFNNNKKDINKLW